MIQSNDPFETFRTVFPRQLPGVAARTMNVFRQMRAFERYTPAQQDSLIASQLRHLLAHARSRSPFWGERLADWQTRGRTTADVLRGVPVMTRTDLQTHRDRMIAEFPERKALGQIISTSSGSTGMPVSFELSPGLFAPIYHAVTMQAADWHGFDPKKPLGALGSKQEDKPQAKLGIPFRWYGPVATGFGYSTKREIPELFELCVRGKPAYLQSGPQVLKRLAQYALAHDRGDLRIEKAFTYGSEVNEEIRDIVRNGLGAEIFDRYSCEETGYIALQCPKHRTYHVTSPETFVEIVDKNGDPCAIGQPGRVLLTAAQSYTMPFIRYDVGDMAEWGEPCDCGIQLPVIRKLWGRIRQNIVTPAGLETFAKIYARDFQDIPGLLEYRFVLHRNAVVVAQLKVEPGAGDIEAPVTERLHRALSYSYPVRIRYVEAIDWGASWKQENFAVSDAPPPS